jgi:hypothetical protein
MPNGCDALVDSLSADTSPAQVAHPSPVVQPSPIGTPDFSGAIASVPSTPGIPISFLAIFFLLLCSGKPSTPATTPSKPKTPAKPSLLKQNVTAKVLYHIPSPTLPLLSPPEYFLLPSLPSNKLQLATPTKPATPKAVTAKTPAKLTGSVTVTRAPSKAPAATPKKETKPEGAAETPAAVQKTRNIIYLRMSL